MFGPFCVVSLSNKVCSGVTGHMLQLNTSFGNCKKKKKITAKKGMRYHVEGCSQDSVPSKNVGRIKSLSSLQLLREHKNIQPTVCVHWAIHGGKGSFPNQAVASAYCILCNYNRTVPSQDTAEYQCGFYNLLLYPFRKPFVVKKTVTAVHTGSLLRMSF